MSASFSRVDAQLVLRFADRTRRPRRTPRFTRRLFCGTAMNLMDPERWRRMQPFLNDALTLPPAEPDALPRLRVRRRPRAARDVRARAARRHAGLAFERPSGISAWPLSAVTWAIATRCTNSPLKGAMR